MFNISEANNCVGSKPAVAVEEGRWGMDGWMEGRVEEQRGRKSGGCGGDGGGIGEWKG